MAEGKAAGWTGLTLTSYSQKRRYDKKEKRSKKEKGVEIWKTEGVSHIPTPQTNNNLFINYL
jgi:hypothetical protein